MSDGLNREGFTGPQALDDEEFAPVHVVQLQLCDPCIDGEGDECHTPGCSLWLNRPPDIGLRNNPSVTIAAPVEPQPAPDLGAAHADLESEIRVAICCACCSPGVPCDLCLRETDRAMKAIDAYARDVAQHERTREQPAPESGTALYLSAIARLSAGLREVRDVCERGDASWAVRQVAAGALADVDRLRLPQPAPGFRMILGPCPVHAGKAHAQIGDDGEWFCLRDLADTAEAVGHGSPSAEIVVPPAVLIPQPGPAVGVVPEDGALALRPLLSATVAVAAGGVIDDDRKAFMTAAFAQDGLRAVFVENATAIGELPPDPALRAGLRAMTARWDDQAATHSRDADKTRNDIAAAALSAKARIYDSNADEVRELLGEGKTGA